VVGVGWDLGLFGLAWHLSPSGSDRLDAHVFAATGEGKAVIASFSEDWRRAAVAAGEDPARSVAAARLATAFYTGEGAGEE
jgi:hypothetical protein